MSETPYCIKGFASGRVQGVGFRYFVMRHANELNVSGYAKNLRDGRVEFLLQGERLRVETVLEKIRSGPRFSVVSDVQFGECDCQDIDNRFQTV